MATSASHAPKRKWLVEVRNFLAQARRLRRDSPTLINKVDISDIWEEAVREANGNLRILDELEFPAEVARPWTLDTLLAEHFDPADAVTHLAGFLPDATDRGEV